MTPLDRGNEEIKKEALNFIIKFWWPVVYFLFSPTIEDNLLTLDQAALIASIIIGYEVNFAAIIRYELHDKAFRDLTLCPSLNSFSNCVMR